MKNVPQKTPSPTQRKKTPPKKWLNAKINFHGAKIHTTNLKVTVWIWDFLGWFSNSLDICIIIAQLLCIPRCIFFKKCKKLINDRQAFSPFSLLCIYYAWLNFQQLSMLCGVKTRILWKRLKGAFFFLVDQRSHKLMRKCQNWFSCFLSLANAMADSNSVGARLRCGWNAGNRCSPKFL